tara:strand:+ start:43 stop:366 length:324 start_codon:yes stop_codon:yes gene_type:complete
MKNKKETGPSMVLKGIGGKVSNMFSVPGVIDTTKMKDVNVKALSGGPAQVFGGIGTKIIKKAGGGLAEATAKLKAKGMSEGGSVVSMDTSPNSGLITTKGFGAGRKT